MSSDHSKARHTKKENSLCEKCDKEVGKKNLGLKCDLCEVWHHILCENVSEALYKAIQDADRDKDTSQGLHWFCKKCNKFASGFMASLNRLSARQDALESKVKDFETKVTQKFEDVDASQEELTERLNTVVGDTTKESIKEIEDRDSRKTHVILFGVEESTGSDTEIRKGEDMKRAGEIIHKGLECEAVIMQTRRLGKSKTDEATAEEGKGARPLLVQVQTQNQAQNIMKSGRKLKEHKDKRFQQIEVKNDMTFLERQEMRNLVILRNQKREETRYGR